MSFQRIVDEFPIADRNNRIRFRHPFRQSAKIRELVPDRPNLYGGACYNICYWFAMPRLTQAQNGFQDLVAPEVLSAAIRNQEREKFEMNERTLRIRGYQAQIIEREFAGKFCLFRVNSTLRNSLEIIDSILAARAVSMLVLRPYGEGVGHALAFDTRVNINFFDPNYGWFVDLSAPVGAAYFRDWFHRFYHASFYKNLFARGRRQLVVWRPPQPS